MQRNVKWRNIERDTQFYVWWGRGGPIAVFQIIRCGSKI